MSRSRSNDRRSRDGRNSGRKSSRYDDYDDSSHSHSNSSYDVDELMDNHSYHDDNEDEYSYMPSRDRRRNAPYRRPQRPSRRSSSFMIEVLTDSSDDHSSLHDKPRSRRKRPDSFSDDSSSHDSGSRNRRKRRQKKKDSRRRSRDSFSSDEDSSSDSDDDSSVPSRHRGSRSTKGSQRSNVDAGSRLSNNGSHMGQQQQQQQQQQLQLLNNGNFGLVRNMSSNNLMPIRPVTLQQQQMQPGMMVNNNSMVMDPQRSPSMFSQNPRPGLMRAGGSQRSLGGSQRNLMDPQRNLSMSMHSQSPRPGLIRNGSQRSLGGNVMIEPQRNLSMISQNPRPGLVRAGGSQRSLGGSQRNLGISQRNLMNPQPEMSVSMHSQSQRPGLIRNNSQRSIGGNNGMMNSLPMRPGLSSNHSQRSLTGSNHPKRNMSVAMSSQASRSGIMSGERSLGGNSSILNSQKQQRPVRHVRSDSQRSLMGNNTSNNSNMMTPKVQQRPELTRKNSQTSLGSSKRLPNIYPMTPQGRPGVSRSGSQRSSFSAHSNPNLEMGTPTKMTTPSDQFPSQLIVAKRKGHSIAGDSVSVMSGMSGATSVSSHTKRESPPQQSLADQISSRSRRLGDGHSVSSSGGDPPGMESNQLTYKIQQGRSHQRREKHVDEDDDYSSVDSFATDEESFVVSNDPPDMFEEQPKKAPTEIVKEQDYDSHGNSDDFDEDSDSHGNSDDSDEESFDRRRMVSSRSTSSYDDDSSSMSSYDDDNKHDYKISLPTQSPLNHRSIYRKPIISACDSSASSEYRLITRPISSAVSTCSRFSSDLAFEYDEEIRAPQRSYSFDSRSEMLESIEVGRESDDDGSDDSSDDDERSELDDNERGSWLAREISNRKLIDGKSIESHSIDPHGTSMDRKYDRHHDLEIELGSLGSSQYDTLVRQSESFRDQSRFEKEIGDDAFATPTEMDIRFKSKMNDDGVSPLSKTDNPAFDDHTSTTATMSTEIPSVIISKRFASNESYSESDSLPSSSGNRRDAKELERKEKKLKKTGRKTSKKKKSEHSSSSAKSKKSRKEKQQPKKRTKNSDDEGARKDGKHEKKELEVNADSSRSKQKKKKTDDELALVRQNKSKKLKNKLRNRDGDGYRPIETNKTNEIENDRDVDISVCSDSNRRRNEYLDDENRSDASPVLPKRDDDERRKSQRSISNIMSTRASEGKRNETPKRLKKEKKQGVILANSKKRTKPAVCSKANVSPEEEKKKKKEEKFSNSLSTNHKDYKKSSDIQAKKSKVSHREKRSSKKEEFEKKSSKSSKPMSTKRPSKSKKKSTFSDHDETLSFEDQDVMSLIDKLKNL